MTIMGPNVSLKQVGNDTNQPKGELGGVHTRARLTNKKTGNISLKSLEDATTAMCVSPIGLGGSDWNVMPTNTYQSYPWALEGSDIRCETPSNDWTKDFRIGGSRRTNGDASFELRQCGYAPDGKYTLKAIGSTDSKELGACLSFAVACFQSGYFVGPAFVPWFDTGVAENVNYAVTINVPAGYPYVAVVGYQINYGPLNQEGRPPCQVGKIYKATFVDARLGKF